MVTAAAETLDRGRASRPQLRHALNSVPTLLPVILGNRGNWQP